MSENKTKNIRREIMMKFLRTLVWIDDEIRPDEAGSMGDPFRYFFYPTAMKFQKKELLVHLHPYDADTSNDGDNNMFDDDSESFGTAVTLAKKADVIILDWHLGQKLPVNSIELLNRLNEEAAIRYVIVLSQYAENFVSEMKQANLLAVDTADSIDPRFFRNIGDAWANGLGTHIIVMKKPNFSSYSSSDFSNSVIESIFALVLKANPDYLHWAALEIAAKLRYSIPGWIQAIPHNTDAAVLSELISSNTEARSFIPEHLLEDLSHLAKLHSLDSLASNNCKPEDWPNSPQTDISDSFESEAEDHDIFIRLNSGIEGISKDAIVKMRKDSESAGCSEFIKCQERLAQFCETISKHVDSKPSFGGVYEQTKIAVAGEKAKIFICISQECDCIRGHNLLFLRGKESKPGPSSQGVTKLLFQGNEYEFTARAEDIMSYKVNSARSIKELKKIGQLRESTARRILSRFWNHLSRSAVNLPTFARIERAENNTISTRDEDSN